jgi:hypothetical protein
VPEYHITQSEVPVSLADDADSQRILVGVVVDGAFHPFAAIAKGVYDDNAKAQQQAAAEAQQAQPAQPQQTEPPQQ